MSDDEREEELISLPKFTDKYWSEVNYINSYAMTMAYLAMGVRGLAYLVVTWTTVVLLGGFVSGLGKKDFWGLTAIVLAQTAGVFDVFLREKMSKFRYTFRGLFHSNFLPGYEDEAENNSITVASLFCQFLGRAQHLLVSLLKTGIQALVLSILMSPVAAVYVFGLAISTAISLWRLIEQDYGGADGSTANLKPALQVLYSLALVQGVLFCYRFFFARTKKHVIERVCKDYGFHGQAESLILRYAEETVTGCEKDPAFAQGRNLITYAVDLIKSEEPGKVNSGVRILERLASLQMDEVARRRRDIGYFERKRLEDQLAHRLGQHKLIRQLVGSTSSSRVLHKLVQMLDPRCPYSMETREHAASIVEYLAGDIHLEQFPRGLQFITSLLNEEYSLEPYQRDWLLLLERHGSDDIVANHKQVYGVELCRLSSWSRTELAVKGLRILSKLARDEENCRVMSNDRGLVSKIMTPSQTSDKFHGDHHDEWSLMALATATVELLAVLIHAHGEAGLKLQRQISTNTQVISAMATILKCDKCFALWTSAAQVMKNLSSHCNKDDECFEKLKTGITDIIPEVLREILRCCSTSDGKQKAVEADFSRPDVDLERGGFYFLVGIKLSGHNITSSQQNGVHKALLSFCATAHNKFTSEDAELAQQFDKIAAAICLEQDKPAKTFTCLLDEAKQLLDATVPPVAESSSREGN